MYEPLRQSLERLMGPLSQEEFVSFLTLLTPRTLARHQHLLRAGEAGDRVAYIVSGCLRYYYLKEGEEYNGQFFFEGGWCGDYHSFLTGEPARQYFEALEDTQVLTISRETLLRLYDEQPRWERFGRLMAESVVVSAQRRVATLLFDSPEERYRHLLRERPKVLERVPLHHIASYLGVRPESLSRIRKRVVTGK